MTWISSKKLILDVRCTYSVTLVVGQSTGPSTISIDSIAYFPNYLASQLYTKSDDNDRIEYDLCVTQLASLITRSYAFTRSACRKIIFSSGTEWHDGVLSKHTT